MDEVLAKVRAFHEKFGLPIGEWDENTSTPSRPYLRWDLIEEEVLELERELFGKKGDLKPVIDKVRVADHLADIVYVVAGAAVEWGIPLAPVFNEVHRSNMTKEGGGYRGDGKVLKGPNYSPPDIARVLAEHEGKEKAPPPVETGLCKGPCVAYCCC